MNKYTLITGMLLLLSLSIASATITVIPTSTTINLQPTSSKDITFKLTNDDNVSVTMQLSRGGSSWIEFDNYSFVLPATPNGTMPTPVFVIGTITVPQNTPSGNYQIVPQFNPLGSTGPTATINVNVTNPNSNTAPTTNTCNVDIFPTTMTNIKIQQGETKTRYIQLTVPTCFLNPIKVNGVSLQTDEKPIQLGEMSLGNVAPGNSIQIPVSIDATDVSVGQYSDTLEMQLYNNTGSRLTTSPVSISVMVTLGVNPITNFSISSLPTCSLSGIVMSLNSTYKLTCTETNPNIEIRPIIDTNLIQGIDVVESGGQYIYEFKPIAIGTTTFKTEFLYKSAVLGTPFEQDISINAGNSIIPGTSMKFEFNPNLDSANDGDIIIVHALDNSTSSYINSATIYLDGLMINNSFVIKAQKNYTLRAVAPGYVDATQQISINPQYATITLSPTSGFTQNKPISVTTNPANCTLFLDGSKQGYLIYSPPGQHLIEAICEGYQTTSVNISEEPAPSLLNTPTELKKNVQEIFNLNKNTTWQITYAKDEATAPVIIASGIGNQAVFTPDKNGFYKLMAEDVLLYNNQIKSFILGEFIGKYWFYVLIVIIAIVAFIIILRRGGSGGVGSYVPRNLNGVGEVVSSV